MNRRGYLLIMAMAVAFITMAWFISSRQELPLTDFLVLILFGIFLVVVALVSVQRRSWIGLPTSPGRDWLKYVFGSFALSFGSWMLGSVLLLPFVGFAGFDLLARPWFIMALCCLALAFFPFVRRFMH
tara:strand:- start:1822 stop:2205 length:384 start_codon:yes stop_codon:yes gene_type:complete